MIVLVVIGGWGLTYTKGCSEKYCEHWRYSYGIGDKMVREIRLKTLENIDFVVKKQIDGCEGEQKKSVKRDFWNSYKVVVDCGNRTMLMPLENEYFYVKFDEAFNPNSFLWDDAFISWWMFKTDPKISKLTLDFWYDRQVIEGEHAGLIPREVNKELGSFWDYDDLRVSGPMFLSRIELEIWEREKDLVRLSRVAPKLVNYFDWLERKRGVTVDVDGVEVKKYLWSGWGSGMDNIPRCDESPNCGYVDLISQQAAMAGDMAKIMKILNNDEVAKEFEGRKIDLANEIKNNYWSEEDGFVYDIGESGGVDKSIQSAAFFWTLYAQVLDEKQTKVLVEKYLLSSDKFAGGTGMLSIARDMDLFDEKGGYWRGGVWPPLIWIGYLSLKENGYEQESFDIKNKYLNYFREMWESEGTLYEYYSPNLSDGRLVFGSYPEAKKDFFGWGVVPIAWWDEDLRL